MSLHSTPTSEIYEALVVTKKNESGKNVPLLRYDAKKLLLTLTQQGASSEKKPLMRVPLPRIVNLSLPAGAEAQKDLVKAEGEEETPGCFKVKSSKASYIMKSPPGSPATPGEEQWFSLTFMPEKSSEPKDLVCFRLDPSDDTQVEPLVRLFTVLESAVYPLGPRRITAFVSPMSGKGKGVALWGKYGIPLFSASRHKLTSIETTHRFHALEWCKDLNNELTTEDIVVCAGGDGMMWEVTNGLKQRLLAQGKPSNDCSTAFQLPTVAVFPTGSGCAMAKGLDILNLTNALLAVIHGTTVPLDLMVLTQRPTVKLFPSKDKKKTVQFVTTGEDKQPVGEPVPVDEDALPLWSFMLISTGFGAEIDRDSEKWRWMGNARFTAYALSKLAGGVPCYHTRIRYVPWAPPDPEVAKQLGFPDWGTKGNESPKTLARHRCTHSAHCSCHKLFSPPSEAEGSPASPPAATSEGKEEGESEDQWVELDCHKFSLLTLNRFGYAAQDMIMAPFCHVADGAIDVCYMSNEMSRTDLVKGLIQLEKGEQVEKMADKFRYVKASKVWLEPYEGYVLADGELCDFHGYVCAIDRQGINVIRPPSVGGHGWN